MHRRTFTLSLPIALLPMAAQAHHGWNSFDASQPVFLSGTAAQVRWANPHVELNLQRDAAALPADLAQRPVPTQTAPVDGPALLARARLPKRGDAVWAVELAPLTRMNAWSVPEIRNGDRIEVLGFTFKDEAGSATLRAEYVWVAGRAYGLRSGPG
jgi:hypothetical protein